MAVNLIELNIRKLLQKGDYNDNDLQMVTLFATPVEEVCVAGDCMSRVAEAIDGLNEFILGTQYLQSSSNGEAKLLRTIDIQEILMSFQRFEVTLRSPAADVIDIEIRIGSDNLLARARFGENSGRVRVDAQALIDWFNGSSLLDNFGDPYSITKLEGTAEIEWSWVNTGELAVSVKLGEDLAIALDYEEGLAEISVDRGMQIKVEADAVTGVALVSGTTPAVAGELPAMVIRKEAYWACAEGMEGCDPQDRSLLQFEAAPLLLEANFDLHTGVFNLDFGATERPWADVRRGQQIVLRADSDAINGTATATASEIRGSLQALAAELQMNFTTLVDPNLHHPSLFSGEVIRGSVEQLQSATVLRNSIHTEMGDVIANPGGRLEIVSDSYGVTVPAGSCLAVGSEFDPGKDATIHGNLASSVCP